MEIKTVLKSSVQFADHTPEQIAKDITDTLQKIFNTSFRIYSLTLVQGKDGFVNIQCNVTSLECISFSMTDPSLVCHAESNSDSAWMVTEIVDSTTGKFIITPGVCIGGGELMTSEGKRCFVCQYTPSNNSGAHQENDIFLNEA